MHGHEVRLKTLTQRVIFELEHERDSQLALQDHSSERFFEPTSRPAAYFFYVFGTGLLQHL